MQPTKWDLILGQRPVPLVDHLLQEVARVFAADLAVWPPEIEAFDAATGAKVAQLLEESPARPDRRLYTEAFRLTRFDLSRDLDAYDDYVRHQRWVEAGLAPGHRDLLLFVSRFMTEQLLGLLEATQGRVNRSKLLEVLAQTERLWPTLPVESVR